VSPLLAVDLFAEYEPCETPYHLQPMKRRRLSILNNPTPLLDPLSIKHLK
jgi:hypothetical protein